MVAAIKDSDLILTLFSRNPNICLCRSGIERFNPSKPLGPPKFVALASSLKGFEAVPSFLMISPCSSWIPIPVVRAKKGKLLLKDRKGRTKRNLSPKVYLASYCLQNLPGRWMLISAPDSHACQSINLVRREDRMVEESWWGPLGSHGSLLKNPRPEHWTKAISKLPVGASTSILINRSTDDAASAGVGG
ncbi:hypothetical protein MUK42_32920 [Musa troglodytarum]|uniref:Uncharacterized protein n=1 Tax=Musa troglodytarum TaxID=320322 RepID=A0A9E7I2V1_9LILI|nr:hypothetical protein MUK42_32920 [Musa troglodytarum]